MTATTTAADAAAQRLLQQGLLTVIDLAHRARHAPSVAELQFLLVNATHELTPYAQALLFRADAGVVCASGVVQPEATAPFIQYVRRLGRACIGRPAGTLAPGQLDDGLRAAWSDWLPEQVLWLPLATGQDGLLLLREAPWLPHELALLQEWLDVWQHAWLACERGERSVARQLWQSVRSHRGQRWRLVVLVLLIAGAALPVRLSVLAPATLVPVQPVVVRSPVDGVIERMLVEPNQPVQRGQPLLGFDETELQGRLQISLQTLATAEVEYRQAQQGAVSDTRFNAQLAALQGRVDQSRAESEYWAAQLQRARVVAPQAGFVLFGDVNEWVGRPVQTGERIMRIAAVGAVEVEGWLDVGDLIPLPPRAAGQLYLDADPLRAAPAELQHIAYEAVARPDGRYAYRVRARLLDGQAQRPGLKGTLKLSGERVPLIYWMLRRPLALVRQQLGW